MARRSRETLPDSWVPSVCNLTESKSLRVGPLPQNRDLAETRPLNYSFPPETDALWTRGSGVVGAVVEYLAQVA